MLLWGWQGDAGDSAKYLGADQSKELLNRAKASANMSAEEQKYWQEEALGSLKTLEPLFEQLALERAAHLVEAHERFREALDKGHRFKVVEPILPMDLMGLYVLVPDIANAP